MALRRGIGPDSQNLNPWGRFMNRPYTGLAKWMFLSYKHLCMNEAPRVYVFPQRMGKKTEPL